MIWWKYVYYKTEKLIDILIPISLLILLIIIVTEIFFHHTAEEYHHAIIIIDYCIIGVFSADLFFKYMRVRNIKKFVRTNWLDIIAVFPFFLIFRFLEPFLFIFSEFQKETKTAQLIFHESLEVSKSTSKIVREVEGVGKVSRARYMVGAFRAIGRAPRFLKAAPFFEHPTTKNPKEKKKVKKKKK
jgi:hypothetical protein